MYRYILQPIQSPSADAGGYTRLCQCLRPSGIGQYIGQPAANGKWSRFAATGCRVVHWCGRTNQTIPLDWCRRVYTSAPVFLRRTAVPGGDVGRREELFFARNGCAAEDKTSGSQSRPRKNQSLSTDAGRCVHLPASEPKECCNIRRAAWKPLADGGLALQETGDVNTGDVMNLSGLEHVSSKECYLNIARRRKEV